MTLLGILTSFLAASQGVLKTYLNHVLGQVLRQPGDNYLGRVGSVIRGGLLRELSDRLLGNLLLLLFGDPRSLGGTRTSELPSLLLRLVALSAAGASAVGNNLVEGLIKSGRHGYKLRWLARRVVKVFR